VDKSQLASAYAGFGEISVTIAVLPCILVKSPLEAALDTRRCVLLARLQTRVSAVTTVGDNLLPRIRAVDVCS